MGHLCGVRWVSCSIPYGYLVLLSYRIHFFKTFEPHISPTKLCLVEMRSQDSQIGEVTHVVSKAFKDFNAAVGAAREVVDEEFGDDQMTPIILQGWVHQQC